jgi:hypothetical protein
MNKLRFALVGMVLPFWANAQESGADSIFRSHQKYYVVAAVLTLIFIRYCCFFAFSGKAIEAIGTIRKTGRSMLEAR